jgi:hypothetical protein
VVVRDLEGWAAIGVQKTFFKKLSLSLKEDIRLEHNISELNQFYTQFDVKYTPIKLMYLEFGYRYIRDKEDEGYFNYGRYNLDLGVKHDIRRFSFDYRFRYQNKNEFDVSIEDGDYPEHYFRLKIESSYNIKKWKWDPEFSVELFRTYEKYTVPEFDNLRFTLGTAYEFKKLGKLSLFYRIDQEFNAPYPKTTSIIGTAFTFKL